MRVESHLERQMGRITRSSTRNQASKKVPCSKPAPKPAAKPRQTKPRAAAPRPSVAKPPAPAPAPAAPPAIGPSTAQCEYSDGGERLTFHLPNGNSYTISPADSSPEHFWGTIYSAEWSHPESVRNCTCAIKASDFIMQTSSSGGEDTRKEYRRPRVDFEREVRTFQNTRHHNVLQMYDFWEWDGRGYIAMKKLKGSLGDILYESEYYHLLQEIRRDETILAELVRQVPSPHPPHNIFLPEAHC